MKPSERIKEIYSNLKDEWKGDKPKTAYEIAVHDMIFNLNAVTLYLDEQHEKKNHDS